MASTYSYPKASALATRTLISPSEKPAGTPSSASHDHEDASSEKSLLPHGTSTNNYAEAVAASNQSPPAIGTAPGQDFGRPGLVRKQSWKMQDMKREQHAQIINSPASAQGMGYLSTAK